MDIISLVILEACIIGIFTYGHAFYIKKGGTIFQADKGPLAILEIMTILLILTFLHIPDPRPLFTASVVLFPGIRWQRDYLLNWYRGLPLKYTPPSETKTLSNTDRFLGRFKPPTQVAIRTIVLVLSILAAYIILYYA